MCGETVDSNHLMDVEDIQTVAGELLGLNLTQNYYF